MDLVVEKPIYTTFGYIKMVFLVGVEACLGGSNVAFGSP
jgi:hypothetical protein